MLLVSAATDKNLKSPETGSAQILLISTEPNVESVGGAKQAVEAVLIHTITS